MLRKNLIEFKKCINQIKKINAKNNIEFEQKIKEAFKRYDFFGNEKIAFSGANGISKFKDCYETNDIGEFPDGEGFYIETYILDTDSPICGIDFSVKNGIYKVNDAWHAGF